MKKLISLGLVLCMLLAMAVPFTAYADGTAQANSEKTIDLYLIAGQSNASGTTKITDASAAYLWAPELRNGYTNIHYAGNSRSNTTDRDLPWQKVTLGLGITDSTYIGPEAGMAKALSAYYNENTGKEAAIIKYAKGGSSLLNKAEENWASPSYVATLDESEIVEDMTGKLYAEFLAQVKKNVSELAAYGGYTKINICGLYWMQGCNNRSTPTAYQPAFVSFAADIRSDLSKLMQEYTGTTDDCGASEMPIVVGTISQTQNLSSSTAEATNKAFIEMQKGLPSVVENCYVVDNSQYAISGYNSANASSPIVYGSDRWHWNQEDALRIGKNVGDQLLANIGYVRTLRYVPLIEETAQYTTDYNNWATKLATSEKEFEIGTASELLSLFRYLNAKNSASSSLSTGRTFKLTADIDLNPGVDWDEYNADPVGYDGLRPTNLWVTAQFGGVFDGNGHSITGLWFEEFVKNSTSLTIQTANGSKKISFQKMKGIGLFALLDGGEDETTPTSVKNLILGGGRIATAKNSSVDGTSIGSIVGCLNTKGYYLIQKCYIENDFTIAACNVSGTSHTLSYGGLIGSTWSTNGAYTMTIQNTVFDGTLVSPDKTMTKHCFGYFFGKAQKGSGTSPLTVTVEDSMFTGEVLGSRRMEIADSLTYGTTSNRPTTTNVARNYTSQPTATADGLTATATYGVLPTEVAKMMEAYYNNHYTSGNKQYADLILVDTAAWATKLASAETVFEIGTASEFLSLFRYLNKNATKSLSSGKTFKLTADIDLNAGVDWAAYNADPEGYTGIRPSNVWISALFWGTIDGQGHTVTGLWHENFMKNSTVKTVETAVGLQTLSFSAMKSMGLVQEPKDGTTLRNLVLGGGRFHDFSLVGGCSMGALMGCVSNGGTFAIENCYVGADFTVDASDTPALGHSFGGVIGSNWSTDSAQKLTVKNVVFAGTIVTPTVSTPAFGYLIGKSQNSSGTLPITLTMTDCMFTGTLTGSRQSQVKNSLTRGTSGTPTEVGCVRNYTAQPTAADSQYLTKTEAYGVLPMVVADMLSSYYVQDNGTDTIRIISEINSLAWDQIGYDVVMSRTADNKTLTTSNLTNVVFHAVLAGNDTVTAETLTDTEGVAIYGMLLNNLDATETYTITVTPKWVDGETTVYGASHVGVVKIGS